MLASESNVKRLLMYGWSEIDPHQRATCIFLIQKYTASADMSGNNSVFTDLSVNVKHYLDSSLK